MSTAQAIADLPESVRPVAEHLGYAAAARLVDVFPGYRLNIPKSIGPDHALRALGDFAEPLCLHFGGERIDVPTSLLTTEARERRIRALAGEQPDLSVNEIAGRVGVTARHVQRVLNGEGAKPRRPRRAGDDRQLDLIAWLGDSAA